MASASPQARPQSTSVTPPQQAVTAFAALEQAIDSGDMDALRTWFLVYRMWGRIDTKGLYMNGLRQSPHQITAAQRVLIMATVKSTWDLLENHDTEPLPKTPSLDFCKQPTVKTKRAKVPRQRAPRKKTAGSA